MQKKSQLFRIGMNFFIPEGARIFESPNECSPVVNYRKEIERHKNLKITDSF
jgi:hypothetical protein